ncbi:VOC family protein [Roseovarius sp. A21]|uniref:VOC family protein n=1 Tax=Roseovarius bejariae TaxID=2576383 RepID=A0A844CHY7_9RHOB|nr:VOC family protein [Roseovarius bejariae]MRU14267.1 VOC family protein [Roseovarius bejariae]
MLELDHLAVVACDLDEGRAAVEEGLGVALQPGGRHPYFGTHNLLLGLEDGLYLEVIAIDPKAPDPGVTRWFDLDRMQGAPRLGNWICRSDDLEAMVARFPETGTQVALSRGDLNWRMAVPRDGRLPFDNCFPALMQWDCAAHPAARLAASGCRLQRLVVAHPEAGALSDQLAPVLSDMRMVFEVGAPGLRAEIMTPSGLRVLT